MPTTTLSSKSQLVLPAEVRRRLGIRPGDRLVVEVEGDHAVIRKAETSDVAALATFRSAIWEGQAQALDEERNAWDG